MQYMHLLDYLQLPIMMIPRLAALRVVTRLLAKVQVLFGLVIQNEACYVSQC